MLNDIVKNINLVAYEIIKNSVNSNKISHFFLFFAPKNYTINYEWKFLAESIISEKPFTNKVRDIELYSDIHVIDGSKELIKKEMVINGVQKMQETPLEKNGKKILVIKNIDNSNKYSLNALLKFIEEPTKETYIIFTTNKIAKIPSTIKSRAQLINLKPNSYEKIKTLLANNNYEKENITLLARVISDINEANVYNNIIKKYKETLETAFDYAIHDSKKIYRDLNKMINVDNSIYVLNLIHVFFSDIWREAEGFETSFSKKILEKYVLRNFNYLKAIEIINDIMVSLNNNVNFELYKSKILVELEECYE